MIKSKMIVLEASVGSIRENRDNRVKEVFTQFQPLPQITPLHVNPCVTHLLKIMHNPSFHNLKF